jgi:hypothetical protein
MPWTQRGVVFATDGRKDWSRTHTQAPTVMEIGDRLRVYYGTRNDENRSRTSFVEFDKADPTKLLYVHDKPVMDLGDPGTHDEDGVIASHVIYINNELRMYYGGVSRGGNVPYRMSIGVACSTDGGLTFKRAFQGPVIDRTPDEPYMTMAPYLITDNEGGWNAWYGSGIKWVAVGEKFEPIYIIKMAHSSDGLRWKQSNHTCIPQAHPFEANTRPSVLQTADGYEMWFSYRGSMDYRDGDNSYRIGYATSTDGRDWTRRPDPDGLQPSGSGWNSSTMSYPSVIRLEDRKIMFHNGDGFGQSGIGCAVWTDE